MELPHIGQTCSICHRNDYLPFKCIHCDKIVCVDHKSEHGPECTLSRTQFQADSFNRTPSESLKQSCDFCKKITLKLELSECPQCGGFHCLYHRHQVQHECREIAKSKEAREKEAQERANRQGEALNRLKSTCQPRKETAPIAQPPAQPANAKNRELAKRIRVMKLKQSAKGPPNILEQDKIFFEVKFVHEPSSPISNKTLDGKLIRIFTTSRHTVGRMIDWSADELGVTNKNHMNTTSQLIFKKCTDSGEWVALDSQVPFAHYLGNSKLENGDELNLTYQSQVS